MFMKLWLLFGLLLALIALLRPTKADDSPGFFLKISKNIPRIGRRSDKEFDNYFMKNMKTIPRIGRRSEYSKADFLAWLNDEPTTTTHSSSSTKRMLMNPQLAAREYSIVQPVNSNTLIELLDKNAIPSDDVKFVHWKDFDRALLSDAELYEKVLMLGRKPDQHLKEELRYGIYGGYGGVPFFDKINTFGDVDLSMLFNNNNNLHDINDDDGQHSNRYDRDRYMQYNPLK